MSEQLPKLNFCSIPQEYTQKDNSHFHILPIPYEATTSYGQGTALGPKAILDASKYMETYDEELKQETYKLGIHTLPFFESRSGNHENTINELSKNVYDNISAQKEGQILIALGGEHSISPGLVKAFKNKYSDLSVLHFDAHADLRNSFQGSKHSHACASRRMLEYCPVVSCGIRSLSSEEADFIKETGANIFFGKEALTKTKKIKSLLSNNVYISLDIDVLDPSVIPSTGTPEPDGWNWRELCDFIRQIIDDKNIIGMDIVELAPVTGNHAPDFTTAKLIYRIMGYISLSKKWTIPQYNNNIAKR